MAKLLNNTRIYGTGTVDTQLLVNGLLGAHSTNSGVLQLQGGAGIQGGVFVSGVVTATTFVGALSGTASLATDVAGGTAGQLVYQIGANDSGFVGPGTAGQVLTSGGTGAPTYVTTTTLYVGRATVADSVTGGSGTANNIAGGILGQIPYQLGANSTAFIGTGTNGSILQMGANTATFVATSTIYVNRATLADNDSGGAAGGLRYQTGANASTFLSIGTAGQILRVNAGATAPEWINTSSLYAGAAVSALNLFGGTAGQLVYQSAAGTTAFAGPGTAGQLLVSAGTSAPTYTNTSSIQVGFAANLLAGAAGSLPYQSAANATTMLGIGASNSILVSNGSVPSWTINPTIGGNLTIVGNLTVQGTTTQVDSTVTNISDPIITVGLGANGAIPLVDDAKDRGIAFAWTGTQAGLNTGRTGFFGFDRSSLYFTFITSASITNEVVAPAGGTTRGAIDANLAGGTAGQLVYQSAADTTAFAGPGTAGQVLTSGGTGAPTYVTTTTLYVGRALVADSATGGSATANNLTGGILGQIPYQSGPNTTLFIGTGTQGSILQMGANTATFVTTANIYVNSSVNTQNLFGGTAGQLHYQSSPGVTAFAGPGTAGQLLVSGGTGAPTYTNTGSIYVGFADSSNNVRGGILGQIPYQTAANTTAFIGTGTNGSILVMGANTATFVTTANIYVNSAVNAQTIFGGTAGQLVYQSAAGTTAFAGPGTAGQVLTSGGTGAPTYVTTTTLYVGRALTADSASGTSNQANNLNGGILGQIPYQSAANTTLFIGTGTQGSILQMGANTATFVTTANIFVNSAVNAINLFGGTAGQLHYQSGVGVTAFAGPGTAGQVLTSGGTGAPTYVTTTTLYVGRALTADSASGGSGSVNTQIQTASANYFLTFVDSNNAAATAELVYTTSTLFVNPATAQVGLGLINTSSRLTVAGRIESTTDPAGEGGQLVLRGRTAFRWSLDNFQDYFRIIREDDVTEANGVVALGIASNTNATVLIGTTTVTGGERLNVNGGALINGTITATTFAGNLSGNIVGGTAGQLVYQSGANTTAFAGPGTAGQVLTSGGTGAPTYVTTTTLYVGRALTADSASGTSNQANNLNGGILGQIPYQSAANTTLFIGTGTQGSILQMGANTATFVTTANIFVNSAVNAINLFGGTAGQLHYQSGPGVTAFAGPGTAGQLLVSGGTGAPTYTNTGSIYVGFANQSNNLLAGILGQIPYQLASGSTAFIGTGTAGTILQMGANTATFVTTANIYVNSAVNAQTIFGGTAGQLHYQSAAGVTAFAGPGTAGQVLTSGGTGAPTYVTTTTLYVGRALTADSASGTSNQANNLNGGILGQIPYQSAANTTLFIGTGTQGSILQMGANTATFVTTANIFVNSAVNAINLFGGTAGQLHYQSGVGVTAFAGPGTAGQLLVSGGTGAPTYTNTGSIYVGFANQSNNLLAGILGQIPYQLASGSTAFIGTGTAGTILQMGANTATFVTTANIYVNSAVNAQTIFGGTAGQLVYQSAAGVTAFAGPGTAGQVLTSGGTGAPTYVTTTTLYVGRATVADSVSGSVTTAANIAGGILGQIPYQLAAGSTAFIGTGTQGSILQMGANTATFVTTANIFVNSAVNAINLFGGTAGQLHYQSAPGVTAFAGPGTAGQLLVSGGTGAPTYTNTGSIYVGFANQSNNLLAGILGQIPYQLASGSTAFIGTGTAGTILQMGANTATFVTTANIYVNSSVNTQNLFGGTAGQLHYQSAPGVTAFAGPGTAGQVLTSGGTGAPTYVTTTTLYVGRALTADSASGTSNQANNLNGGILGQIPYQSAANTTLFIGTGTQNSLLQMGANTASFVTSSTVQVGFAANLLAGAAGSLPYQSAANATAMLGIGGSNSILVSNGSVPSWTTNPTIGGNLIVSGNLTVQGTTVVVDSTVTNVSDPIITIGTGPNGALPLTDDSKDRGIAFAWTGTQAGLNTGRTGFFGFDRSTLYFTFITSASITNEVVAPAGGTTRGAIDANLAGGTAGQLVYQSAADTTAFAGPGTAGQVLTSGGTGAPTYVTTTTLYVGRAVTADSASGGSGSVNTQIQTASATYFPTFVDSNNAAATAELVYTTSSFTINPATGRVGINTAAATAILQVTGDVRISGVSTVSNTLIVDNATGASSTNTGALTVVNGGAGIGGGLFVGGAFTNTGITVHNNATGVSSTNSGAVQVLNGGVGIGGGLFVGGNFTNTGIATINNATGVSSTNSGAVQVLNGGVGIGGGLFVGGNFTNTGIATINNATGVSSTNSGAVQVLNGGVGIGGGLFVGGIITGTNLAVINNVTGASSTNTAALTILNGGVGIGGGLFVGGITTSSNLTGVHSTVTGALRVAGGVGVGGGLFVGGVSTLTNTTGVNSTITGAFQVAGGVGIGGGLVVGGAITATTLAVTSFANYPIILNDVSGQADGLKCVFPLSVDQTAVTGIVDNKDITVMVDGAYVAPYVREKGLPWINTVNAYRGFRVTTTGTTQNQLIIYNAPDIGSQIVITQINISTSTQIRSYPYSASMIGLGD